MGRDEELQQKNGTWGEGENLANEWATSLASLLTQQKQHEVKVLVKNRILLITDEITQRLSVDWLIEH